MDPQYCDGCIRYLDCDDLIDINRWMVGSFTDKEIIGVHSRSNLEAAQKKPSIVRYYGQTNDLALLAAHLLASIAKLHPFYSANKRTALGAAIVFLRINGYELTPKSEEAIELIVGLVQGEYDECQLAGWIGDNASPSDSADLVSASMAAIMGEILPRAAPAPDGEQSS